MDLDYTYDNNGNILTETIGSRTDTYTYDALNRLTGVDIPGGTTEDVVYGYDVRGNRTDIDVGGTDNTDLTFNALDLCTRIDFEDGSYKIFVHDNEGNCVSEQYFSGTYLSSPVVVPIDTTQTKEELLADYEEMQAKRKHYPYRYAPKELRTTEYLSPYLPETTNEDFYLNSMLDWTNPALADYKRAERWRPDRNTGNSRNNGTFTTGTSNPRSPNSTNTTPDEEIVYLYNQENKLIHTILDSGIEIEFEYDGVGRMLQKTTTDDTGTDIITTTWKYHHANGKITTIVYILCLIFLGG